MTNYVVRTPIRGYSGMGYESIPFVETQFSTERMARKWKKHCDFAYKLHMRASNFGYSGSEEKYYDYMGKMTDNGSYYIRDESKIYLRTVVEEEIK